MSDETNQIHLMTADIVGDHIIPAENFLRRRDPDRIGNREAGYSP
jgi:hypothetical protein